MKAPNNRIESEEVWRTDAPHDAPHALGVAVVTTRKPAVAGNQIDDGLRSVLVLYKRALPLKELPRTGWLTKGCIRSECDFIAAHSYVLARTHFTPPRVARTIRMRGNS